MARIRFFFFILSLYRSCVLGSVVLTNNAYTGLQIVISSSINEDPALITRLQEIFTNASAYLFNATKSRAYFGSIDIVVPENWTSVTIDATTSSVNTSSPYVLVDKPHALKQDNPYVRQLECAKPGDYMHLTTGFINSTNNNLGDRGRVIVHEWGHLWWGLFDEYPSLRNRYTGNYIRFYKRDGQNQPVMCSRDIQGTIEYDENASGLCDLKQATMDPTCRFVPHTNQSTRASIMAHQWINSVTEFCDSNDDSVDSDLRHDPDATNLQNILCDGKSAWEIMREHEDFANDNNPPNVSITDTSPTFRILRKSPKVRVMVFDVSGSMGYTSNLGNFKIYEQAQAAEFVIENIVEKGSYLALVSFSSVASTLAGLTQIDSELTKDTLRALVPRSAGGGTYIDRGLSMAVSIINSSSASPSQGAEIILLSDGQSYAYLHMVSTLKNHGITVHTIAITNYADYNMRSLASQTGGRSFTYLETTSITFTDVLTQAIKSDDATQTSVQQVFGNVYTNINPITGTFIIDDGLGTDTKITVLLQSYQLVTIEVTGPNGTRYTNSESNDLVTLLLDSGNQIQTGGYSFQINLPTTFSGTAEVRVSSSPSSDEAEVIQVSNKLSNSTIDFDDSSNQPKVFVTVLKKHNPVLNANVTLVLAATSSNNQKTIQAYDNGTGADSIRDDGIYSAYLLKRDITENSNHNIKVIVNGGESTSTYSQASSGRASTLPGTEEEEVATEPVGAFERTDVTEEITVTNYKANPADTTPPAKISDFISDLVAIEYINGTFYITYTFTWTAVGSDLDVGQATAYEMRFHHSDSSFVRNNFSLSEEAPITMPNPQASGATESINITFTRNHCNGTCYVGIRATDENNLNGSVSNIATIDIDFTYTFESPDPANETVNTINTVNHPDKTKTDTLLLALLVSVPLVVILGLVIVAVVVLVYKHNNIQNKIGCSRPCSGVGIDLESSLVDNSPHEKPMRSNTTKCENYNRCSSPALAVDIDPDYAPMKENHMGLVVPNTTAIKSESEVIPYNSSVDIDQECTPEDDNPTDNSLRVIVTKNEKYITEKETGYSPLETVVDIDLESATIKGTPFENSELSNTSQNEYNGNQNCSEFTPRDSDVDKDLEPVQVDNDLHELPIVSMVTENERYSYQNITACSTTDSAFDKDIESCPYYTPENTIRFIEMKNKDPFRTVRTMFLGLHLKEDEIDDIIFSIPGQTKAHVINEDSETEFSLPHPYEQVLPNQEATTSSTAATDIKSNDIGIKEASNEDKMILRRYDTLSVKSGLWFTEDKFEDDKEYLIDYEENDHKTVCNPISSIVDVPLDSAQDDELKHWNVKMSTAKENEHYITQNVKECSPPESDDDIDLESAPVDGTLYKNPVRFIEMKNKNPFRTVKTMFSELPLKEPGVDDNVFSISKQTKVEVFNEEIDIEADLTAPYEILLPNQDPTVSTTLTEDTMNSDTDIEDENEVVLRRYDTLSVKSGLWFTESKQEVITVGKEIDCQEYEDKFTSKATAPSTFETQERQVNSVQLDSQIENMAAIGKEGNQAGKDQNEFSPELHSGYEQNFVNFVNSLEEVNSNTLSESTIQTIDGKEEKFTHDFGDKLQCDSQKLAKDAEQNPSDAIGEEVGDSDSTNLERKNGHLNSTTTNLIVEKSSSVSNHRRSEELNSLNLITVGSDIKNQELKVDQALVAIDGTFMLETERQDENNTPSDNPEASKIAIDQSESIFDPIVSFTEENMTQTDQDITEYRHIITDTHRINNEGNQAQVAVDETFMLQTERDKENDSPQDTFEATKIAIEQSESIFAMVSCAEDDMTQTDLDIIKDRHSIPDTHKTNNEALIGYDSHRLPLDSTTETDSAIKHYLGGLNLVYVHPKPPEKTEVLFDEDEDERDILEN